jgi:hypothetical protein
MAKWCDEGETSVGNVYLKATAKPDYYLGLYKNVAEPGEADTMAAITEAQVIGVNGYARIQLLDADWTEQATKGVFKNLQKTFTANGGAWGSITGYFITTAAAGVGGKLIAVEHFSDGPYTVNDLWSVLVTPQITIT